MTLTKTDITVASRYVEQLVPPQLHHMWHSILEEFNLTLRQVLAITGDAELLDRYPILQRTPAHPRRARHLSRPDQLLAGGFAGALARERNNGGASERR
jgi:phosphoenolpyruvate carboxylase